MTLQKGTKNGLPILQDSAAVGVPLTTGDDQGADILLGTNARVANARSPFVVDTVADMQALTGADLINGQTYQTLRYSSSHTVGDGSGNFYRYVAGSSTTADGGFVISASGGRFFATDTTVANVMKFGAVGDGITDDAAAIQAAMATELPAVMPQGTYRVETEISVTGDVIVIGDNAVLSVSLSGEAITIVGSATISGITIDGNNTSGLQRGLFLGGSGADIVVSNCKFTSFDSITYVQQLVIGSYTINAATISNCQFTDAIVLADGVIGNADGASRAIYAACSADSLLIENCWFNNINCRDGSDAVVQEDADAIQLPESATIGATSIVNCVFKNVGKRAIKCSGNTRLLVDKCYCDSGWTGAGTNGMVAFVESFGCDVVVRDSNVSGGRMRTFVSASGTSGETLIVDSCVHTPTYSATVEGSNSRFLITPISRIKIVNCVSSNTENGIYAGSAMVDVYIAGNDFTTYGSFIELIASSKAEFIGNTFTLDASSASTTSNLINVLNGTGAVAVIGNTSSGGWRDGLIIASQSGATPKVSLIGNEFAYTALIVRNNSASQLAFTEYGNAWEQGETITASTATLNAWGCSVLDSTSNAITATLPDGKRIGQRKTVCMSNASNSSTVSANGGALVTTFNAVTDYAIFEWMPNSDWKRIYDGTS